MQFDFYFEESISSNCLSHRVAAIQSSESKIIELKGTKRDKIDRIYEVIHNHTKSMISRVFCLPPFFIVVI